MTHNGKLTNRLMRNNRADLSYDFPKERTLAWNIAARRAWETNRNFVDEKFPEKSPPGWDYKSSFERKHGCKVRSNWKREVYLVFDSAEELTAFLIEWAGNGRQHDHIE